MSLTVQACGDAAHGELWRRPAALCRDESPNVVPGPPKPVPLAAGFQQRSVQNQAIRLCKCPPFASSPTAMRRHGQGHGRANSQGKASHHVLSGHPRPLQGLEARGVDAVFHVVKTAGRPAEAPAAEPQLPPEPGRHVRPAAAAAAAMHGADPAWALGVAPHICLPHGFCIPRPGCFVSCQKLIGGWTDASVSNSRMDGEKVYRTMQIFTPR